MPDRQDLSASLYKTIVENSRDIITLVDTAGLIIFQSPAVERLTGYVPEDLVGRNVFDFIHPDDVDYALQALSQTIDDLEGNPRIVIRFLHKHQSWCDLEVAGQILESDGDTKVMLQAREVTDQQQMLRALKTSEEAFQAAFNATSAVSAMTIPETGEFLQVNDAWVSTLGWQREEAIGKTAYELNIWGTTENRNLILKELEERGTLQGFRASLFTREGKERIALIDAEFLTTADGLRMFISGIDITEREQIEAQLRQSQKLESIGQLTGGIAHDFNNLLSVIIGHTELASMEIADPRKVTKSLSVIQRSAESGAKLVQQLLAFSRKQKLTPETFQLGEHLKSMGSLLHTTLGKNIDLEISTNDDGWYCHLDITQLDNAILNIALNARDAMPDGGVLTFKLNKMSLETVVALEIGLPPGDYLQLEVNDTGTGMAPDIIDRAFEPFFTTKQSAGGTGLGLSMVFGFTKQSGGHISITSNRRGASGTTISLLLPRGEYIENEQKVVDKPTKEKRSERRVLLVEDNDDVRSLISKLLGSLGLTVVEASSGDDINKFDALSIDLLVSDVMLPGDKKGPDIARVLRKTHPQLAVLYMSGFQQGMLSEDDLSPDKVGFIQKPFSRKDFSIKIDALLED